MRAGPQAASARPAPTVQRPPGGDGGVIGDDPHHAGAAFDLLVDVLEQVGAPGLFQVGPREVTERQHARCQLRRRPPT